MMSTYTYATVPVSQSAYEEIKAILLRAGYEHAIKDGVIDMHGLALVQDWKQKQTGTSHTKDGL